MNPLNHTKEYLDHTKEQTTLEQQGKLFTNCSKEMEFDIQAWFETSKVMDERENKLLEVVVSWEGGVLDIGHYETPRRLTFGADHRADFCYPLELPTDQTGRSLHFPLIEAAKGGFLLCFLPEMDGIVEQNGEKYTLMELIEAGKAHYFNLSRKGKCYCPLTPGNKVTLNCKGFTIHIEFVPAPKYHPSFLRQLDPVNASALSFSVITHLAFAVFAILSTQSPQKNEKTMLQSKKESIPLPSFVTTNLPELPKGWLRKIEKAEFPKGIQHHLLPQSRYFRPLQLLSIETPLSHQSSRLLYCPSKQRKLTQRHSCQAKLSAHKSLPKNKRKRAHDKAKALKEASLSTVD